MVTDWMVHVRAGQTDRQTRFNGNCLCDWHTANGQTKTDNFRPFLNFLLLFLSSVVASFFNLSFLCLYLLSHCCSPAWFYFFFSLRAFCSDLALPVGVTASQIHQFCQPEVSLISRCVSRWRVSALTLFPFFSKFPGFPIKRLSSIVLPFLEQTRLIRSDLQKALVLCIPQYTGFEAPCNATDCNCAPACSIPFFKRYGRMCRFVCRQLT